MKYPSKQSGKKKPNQPTKVWCFSQDTEQRKSEEAGFKNTF